MPLLQRWLRSLLDRTPPNRSRARALAAGARRDLLDPGGDRGRPWRRRLAHVRPVRFRHVFRGRALRSLQPPAGEPAARPPPGFSADDTGLDRRAGLRRPAAHLSRARLYRRLLRGHVRADDHRLDRVRRSRHATDGYLDLALATAMGRRHRDHRDGDRAAALSPCRRDAAVSHGELRAVRQDRAACFPSRRRHRRHLSRPHPRLRHPLRLRRNVGVRCLQSRDDDGLHRRLLDPRRELRLFHQSGNPLDRHDLHVCRGPALRRLSPPGPPRQPGAARRSAGPGTGRVLRPADRPHRLLADAHPAHDTARRHSAKRPSTSSRW